MEEIFNLEESKSFRSVKTKNELKLLMTNLDPASVKYQSIQNALLSTGLPFFVDCDSDEKYCLMDSRGMLLGGTDRELFDYTFTITIGGYIYFVTLKPPTLWTSPPTAMTPCSNRLRDDLAKLLTRLPGQYPHFYGLKDHTLVKAWEGGRFQDQKHSRIDRQFNANAIYSKIAFQSGPHPSPVYAEVMLNKFAIVFGARTSLYVGTALWKSVKDQQLYKVEVVIEKAPKENKKKRKPVKDAKESDMVVDRLLENPTDISKLNNLERTMKVLMNSMTVKRQLLLGVLKLIEKLAAKQMGKSSAKVIAKKIPLVSTAFGTCCAIYRAASGDFVGATGEMASGLIGEIPGIGTAISLGIDAGLIAKDVVEAKQKAEEEKEMHEKEIKRMEEEMRMARNELNNMRGDSPFYGNKKAEDKHWDDSEVAEKGDISKIEVYHSNDGINGIQFYYQNTPGSFIGTNAGRQSTFSLESGEHICSITGTINNFITGLSFETNAGREMTFGVNQGSSFDFTLPNGSHLGNVEGYGSSHLSSIQFIPKYYDATNED